MLKGGGAFNQIRLSEKGEKKVAKLLFQKKRFSRRSRQGSRLKKTERR
jgi:hypothetical protein